MGLDLGLIWGVRPGFWPILGVLNLDLGLFGGSGLDLDLLGDPDLDLGLFWGSRPGFGPILGCIGLDWGLFFPLM